MARFNRLPPFTARQILMVAGALELDYRELSLDQVTRLLSMPMSTATPGRAMRLVRAAATGTRICCAVQLEPKRAVSAVALSTARMAEKLGFCSHAG
jgi:hypothetical protein